MDNVGLLKFTLQWVASSRWAWVADISLLLILTFTTVFILSRIVYSPPVQRLWEDVKRLSLAGMRKVRKASSSPYDKKFENSKTVAWITIAYCYSMSFIVLLVGMPFFMIGTGVIAPDDLPFYKRLVALGIGAALWFFARLLKVQADRGLHKLRKKEMKPA